MGGTGAEQAEHQARMDYIKDDGGTMLATLVAGYESQDGQQSLAQNCGPILQEILRKDVMCTRALNDDNIFPKFFEYVQLPNFEDSSVAFQTFKVFMFRHKMVRECFVQYLAANYQAFFDQYHQLIQCNNYVTRRQSLKLLGEILLDRKNFKVMMEYINNKKNLQLMMRLLKAQSKA